MFSFINIIGLAIGLASVFLIYNYIEFEKSYDKFHTNAQRIFRLSFDIQTPNEVIHSDKSSALVAEILKKEFPEIENFTRFGTHSILVRNGEKKFQEENTLYADSTLFSVFDFKLLKGDKKTALAGPLKVVLTESNAKKYFGNDDPINKPILLGGFGHHAVVTGVIADFPDNSHIKANILLSLATQNYFSPGILKEPVGEGWFTFLLLKSNTDIKAFEKKISNYNSRYFDKELSGFNVKLNLVLEPLGDIYLSSTRKSLDSYKFAHGSIENINTFSAIGLFILIIGFINYINLSTSRATERAKEVGVRKVSGASRRELIFQFLFESVIITLIASLLSIMITSLCIPLLNDLSGKPVFNSVFENRSHLIILLLISVGIGVLAGIYPSLILSAFKPISVLKGKLSSTHRGILLRKSLVVFQFTVAITLIIATLIVYDQLNFLKTKDLGFNKEQKLILDFHFEEKGRLVSEEIRNLSGVKSVAISGSVPGYEFYKHKYKIEIEDIKNNMQSHLLSVYFIDHNFLSQYNIPVIAGRNFSKDLASDSTQAIIISEKTAKVLGYTNPNEAIEKKILENGNESKIIGVTRDFHDESLRKEISPSCFKLLNRNLGTFITVNLTGNMASSTMKRIEKVWNKIIGHRPFNYFFLDGAFDRQYRAEEQFGKLFITFTTLAIIISCLGLIGLASFNTIQRKKEIGLRKLLGAKVGNIVSLLSKEYIKLVVLAFVIASASACIMMNKWLENFAYRTHMSLWIYVISGLSAITIAFISISFLTIKASTANPVKSLRTE